MIVTENDNNEEKEAMLWVLIKKGFYKTNLEIAHQTVFEALVSVFAPLTPGDKPSLL